MLDRREFRRLPRRSPREAWKTRKGAIGVSILMRDIHGLEKPGIWKSQAICVTVRPK